MPLSCAAADILRVLSKPTSSGNNIFDKIMMIIIVVDVVVVVSVFISPGHRIVILEYYLTTCPVDIECACVEINGHVTEWAFRSEAAILTQDPSRRRIRSDDGRFNAIIYALSKNRIDYSISSGISGEPTSLPTCTIIMPWLCGRAI